MLITHISYISSIVYLVYFITVRGQSDVKSSLTFVIDDTGSMGDDIEQVIENVKLVFNTITYSNKSQIENFVLVTFNDPDAKTLVVTKDEDVFTTALEYIDVHGGGDCPEYAMKGIKKALEESLPGSYFYVFTDASAKDYNETERIQSLAISKQTQIVFLLTGKCEERNHIDKQKYQAYHTLAKATSGHVFQMAKGEVGKVLNYISSTVENRQTKLFDANFPPGNYTFNFTVDGGIGDMTVVVAGENPTAKVYDPVGKECDTETLVNISGAVILKVPDPTPGQYTVKVGSGSDTAVSVSAETTVHFRHGFSILEPTSFSEATVKPIAGEKSYISIQLLTSEDDMELQSIEIVDMGGNIIMGAPVTVVDEDLYFYATEPLISPNDLFKIAINVYDHKSNTTIRRYGLTPIEPQKPNLVPVKIVAPTIEIVEGLNINAEYREPLKLTCKVTAYPKPDIIWVEINTKTIMNSKDAVVEYPYEYVSVLEIDHVDKNATYRCTATNEHDTKDSDHVTVTTERKNYFDVIETPKDIDIEYGEQGSVNCKVDAYPPPIITWYFNGSEIKANDNVEITEDSLLTIYNMDLNLAGEYMCEARNDFNRSVTNFKITATGLEPPVIRKDTSEITALKGSDAYIVCSTVRGIPTPTISWSFKSADSSVYNIIAASANQTDRLYLEKVTTEQSGTYKCTALNSIGKDRHYIDFDVEYAPTIKPDVKIEKARQGSRKTLKCVVDAVPTAHVRWFLNDTLIMPSRDLRIYRDHSLRFTASLANSGTFRCEAENIHGKDTKDVQVYYYAPVIIEIPDDSTMVTRVGSSLMLPCHADGFPKPGLKWTFFSFDPKEPRKILRTANPEALTLKNIQLKQDGFYTCTAANIGEMANITYRVEVNAPPVIVNADKKPIYKAVLGDLALRVPCKATGNPKPKIIWSLRGFNIATGTKWYDVEDDGTLVIKDIDIKSRGYFKCKAENKLGSDEKHFLVDVSSIPSKENITSTINVKENETVDVKCDAPHTKVDKVRWYKNNKEIAEDKLHLVKVTTLDAGVYTCRVSNFFGSVSASTELIVGSAPRFQSEVDLNIDFEEGSYTALDCSSNVLPNPSQTQWFYEGKKITAVGMAHSFIMDYSNIGHYMCIVSNEHGSINRTFSIKPAGCLLNVLEDFQENHQPLIIPPSYPTLKTIGQYLHFPRYESVKLSCPKRFTRFATSEIIAICDQDSDFRVNGKSYKFTELSCTSQLIPEFKTKGLRCGQDNTEVVDIGYSIDKRNFLSVYEVCVDKDKNRPIYTKHTLHQSSTGVDPKNEVWQDNYLVPFDFQQMYDCDAQNAHISNLIGKAFHIDDGCCFGKRQLVNPKDMMPGLPQVSTYNYLNVVPQWSTCTAHNWDELEQRVRTLPKSTNDEFIVWTGHSVHKPLELETESAENWQIDIQPQIVSTYLWKVVQDPAMRSSLAIVQVNVPDLTDSDKTKYTLCTDICYMIEWMKDKEWQKPSEGYTYCCEIKDFEKAFGYFNMFSPTGDIILKDVSLISLPGLTI